MFNYTKETILNNINNVIVGTGSNGLAQGEFAIKRAGNYVIANILEKKMFKTVGVQGSKGKAKLTVSTNSLTEGTLCRMTMFVSTPEKEIVEYALPSWQPFGKPVLIEFSAGASANATAEALANALKLSLNEDNKLFTVSYSANTAYVYITLAESWMNFKECTFEVFNASTSAWEVTSNITFQCNGSDGTVVPVADFATAKWIEENLRFPSYPNRRYNALFEDEAPAAGTVYNQYSFQYNVKHTTPGGLSGVGQIVDSLTTHILYVPQTSASSFEGLFAGTGLTFDTTDNVADLPVIPTSATTTVDTSGLMAGTEQVTGSATAQTTLS